MSPRLPARFGLRAKLLSGAAVLLAFTAVIGVLGIRANADIQRELQTNVRRLGEAALRARDRPREVQREPRVHEQPHPRADRRGEGEAGRQDQGQRRCRGQEPGRGQGLAQDGSRASSCSPSWRRRSMRTATARGEVLALSDAGKEQEAYALNKQKLLPLVARRPPTPSTGCSTPRSQLAATEQRANRGDRLFGAHARDRAAARGDRGRLRDGAVVLAPDPAHDPGDPRPHRDAPVALHDRSAQGARGGRRGRSDGRRDPGHAAARAHVQRRDRRRRRGRRTDPRQHGRVRRGLQRDARAARSHDRRALRRRRHGRRRVASRWRRRPTRPAAPCRRSPSAVTEVANGAERQVRGVEATREAVQGAARSAQASARDRHGHRRGRRPGAGRRARGRRRGELRERRDARGRGVLGRGRRGDPGADRALRAHRRHRHHDHRPGRADQPAGAQRRDRGRPRRRAGPRVRGRRRGGPQAGRGVPERGRGRSPR